MMRVLFGLVVLAIGLWAFVGLARPEHRTPWRGSKHPAGAASHLGFGLVFTFGGILAFLDPPQDDPPVLLVLVMLLGFAIGFVGFVLDSLRDRRLRREDASRTAR